MTIKIANRLDMGDVAALDEACFPGDARAELGGSIWWLAWDDDLPVGFAGITLLGYGIAYLCRAGVIESHRGRGVHGSLIRARIAYARICELNQIITYTKVDNTASANNLIDDGFELYLPENQWAGEKNVLYWRRDA
jgi:GNAT superfamily N-acetyltransferase